MEGQNLYKLVKGQVYNSELRNNLAQFGLRRIANNQWISKSTATKYELQLEDANDQKVVVGLDIIENGEHIGVIDPFESIPMDTVEQTIDKVSTINVHHKTLSALQRQLDVTYHFLRIIDEWNEEMEQGTNKGQQLQTIVNALQISWENLFFLPDPMCNGEYLFGAIRKGKAASIHSWLELLDEEGYVVPADDSEDGAYESLLCGKSFHAWEFESFDTPAAAGQYAIKVLNASKSTYAMTIRKLLGKENGRITRNDFYRNEQNVMCRVEIIHNESGLSFRDIPALPTLADCIDSLLAPFIRAKALEYSVTDGGMEYYDEPLF